ncbi:hypothetical protein ACLOJK_032060 [Asimina triloba]
MSPPPPIPTSSSSASASLCSAIAPPDLFLAVLSLVILFRPHLRRFPTHRSNPCRSSLALKSPPITTSISTMQKPPPPPSLLFSSPQSLSDWLRPRLPNDSLSSWGVAPGTKNVHNLWLELSEGETSLADSSPPIRTVHVASVRILDASASRALLESHQELSDGSVRPRNRPLSEKMKPHETIEEAVCRAVREELNVVDGGSIRILPGSYVRKVEERASLSYPGLPACYVLHSVDAWVEGLPDGEFCTEEREEYGNSGETEAMEKAVSVKRHFWKWVDANSVAGV